MLDDFWDLIKNKANVVGYSKQLKMRIRDGNPINEKCFRVYVAVKLPLSSLKLEDIIPDEIDGIPTDIVAIGRVQALGYIEKTRPLVAGISIGNWSITAGTLGWFFKDGKGREMIGSNAHVLATDPLRSGSSEKRIVQPGRHDGGTLDDRVAQYYWHKPLGNKSDCVLSLGVVSFLNRFSSVLHRKTRFSAPVVKETHHIDFALAEPETDFELLMMGLEEFDDFVGLGFAGSDQVSFFCKNKYIADEGWFPIDKQVATVKMDDIIHKVGRTTEYTNGKVIDDSAHGTVWYSNTEYVEFDDVIMTKAMLEGGDSGDAAWLTV